MKKKTVFLRKKGRYKKEEHLIYKMKLVFISLIGIILSNFSGAQICSTKYDPYITTFDGMRYDFQYSGDHYIMYDDFKNTRVTSGFQKCGWGSCNCAVYVQKNRKLMFVDFCNVQSNTSPTSKIYGVSVEQNHIGPKAIREIPQCPVISPLYENSKTTWESIPTILGSFKCARLQGSNYYTDYLIRTVENHFEDSVLVKFQLANQALPILSIQAPNSTYQSTGGLCGRWDGNGNRNTDLYVLDRHGLESFVSPSNLSLIKDFWNLNSVYNKRSSYKKRCAECMLMSERSFYCPCDDFDLFDQKNYNLPPNRANYCKVPMHACVEKHFKIKTPDQNISSTPDFFTSTQFPMQTTTAKKIEPEEASNICWTSFMNHPGLNNSLNNGCLDRNVTIQFCIDDVTLTSDPSFVKIHLESSIDITIQNILKNQTNCDPTDLQMLCPNACSGNGVCKFEQRCILPGIINHNCSVPLKCECNSPYGGADCSLDLTNITEFTVKPQFCDLRTEKCSLVNGFGYPFSTRDPIYVQIEYTEYDIDNRPHFVTETSVADTITDNNILIGLNRLSSLNLYKNIHSIRTSFVSRDTLADAHIYISYSNVSFVQWANLTLYDSKCRTEDEETGSLVFLDDRCDIEGVCYVRNQTHPNNPNFICNPNASIDSWTLIPTPDPLCNGDSIWTEWFNYDSPQTGEGDLELYHEHQYGCKYPSRVQARTVDGIAANQTEQVNWLVPLYEKILMNVLTTKSDNAVL
ncbi:von Willebrand factor D and EGF domain-containing [Brachionus plicatilis]|uniref:von Willebrand factor D and EGF domain-containing n=1 Tax=Brachionus plicatilis TaxID=10195 RepID=A0A3M7QRD9_BRAPC|nr:von Willebrand factor D and EGF domain-containing [Brachionus plicatilis]